MHLCSKIVRYFINKIIMRTQQRIIGYNVVNFLENFTSFRKYYTYKFMKHKIQHPSKDRWV